MQNPQPSANRLVVRMQMASFVRSAFETATRLKSKKKLPLMASLPPSLLSLSPSPPCEKNISRISSAFLPRLIPPPPPRPSCRVVSLGLSLCGPCCYCARALLPYRPPVVPPTAKCICSSGLQGRRAGAGRPARPPCFEKTQDTNFVNQRWNRT